MPFISVIITAYKRKDFLKYALESALNQTLPRENYEVIVVKDFEDRVTDNSDDIYTIRVGESNIGSMLYEGIKAAHGDVISFLDDDDLFTREKLQVVFNIFNENDDLIFMRNGFSTIDSRGTVLKEKNKNNKIYILNRFESLNEKYIKLRFNMSCISIRKKVVKNYMDYIKQIESAQDISVFYLSAAHPEAFALVEEPLTLYRVHPKSSTHNPYVEYEREVKSLKIIEGAIDEDFIRASLIRARLRLTLLMYLFNQAPRGSFKFLINQFLREGLSTWRDYSAVTLALASLVSPKLGKFLLKFASGVKIW